MLHFRSMDISVFLSRSEFRDGLSSPLLPSHAEKHVHFFDGDLEELEGKKVAIIGVCENRGSASDCQASDAPDAIRKYLYRLHWFDGQLSVIDLGNIRAGNELKDTYYALNQTCEVLLRRGIIPLIIGGTQDLTFANYQAYERMEQTVNLVTIDYRLDFGKSDGDIHSKNYLNKVVLHKPNYLFNYSNIGHQRYLVESDLLELMGNMYFDAHRLGDIQSGIQRSEPIIRNADILSVDMSAIRMGESPGSTCAGPNGFYGDEAAQLCRYAGMSDKLTSFGLYEVDPLMDLGGHTCHLAAQLIWCFLEGVSQRKGDYPIGDYSEYFKYLVPITHDGHELVFYKSNLSDRWWMDVPYPAGTAMKYERHHMVPCTYEEFQQASSEEMPDRWWKTYQKLV
jgi:arginase family enzyme